MAGGALKVGGLKFGFLTIDGYILGILTVGGYEKQIPSMILDLMSTIVYLFYFVHFT